MANRIFPTDVEPYQRTAEFTETTIPAGLLREHSTRGGVWGRICVLEGKLSYEILGPVAETQVLSPGTDGMIEPEMLHQVRPLGSVRFFVEFLRRPAATS